jgi:antitoxin component HigA of HigAB toxin-antitoxin module
MSRTQVSNDALLATFEELCAMHLPRTIRDKVDYQNTAEIVDRLAVLDRRTRGQDEYLETLTQLIEAYDNGNFQVAVTAGPLDAIRFLMDAHDLSASDIGRILGSRSLGAAILRRDRQISKENALRLAANFKLNPGLFIARWPASHL